MEAWCYSDQEFWKILVLTLIETKSRVIESKFVMNAVELGVGRPGHHREWSRLARQHYNYDVTCIIAVIMIQIKCLSFLFDFNIASI